MKTMQTMHADETGKMMHPMRTRRLVIAAAVVVLGAIAWYLFRPELLFVNKSVNESFPSAATNTAGGQSSDAVIATGMFHKAAHETKGTATIHRVDGKHVLRLTGFETSNGPDVHVYLTAANDANDNDSVTKAGFVDLGSLKGNVGDQNYELPADLETSKYHAVTIWCKRFGVNFGTAPLIMPGQSTAASSEPKEISSGMFHSGAHETKGTATIHQLAEGQRVLRLTGFETSNGPDLHVYFVAADDAKDSDAVTTAGFVDIGSLKGNVGDQNYELPNDLDLAKYKAVTVWCKRFSVNFGTAPLMTK